MNPVVMTLEGLLAVLLASTLLFGLKLERKLKALRQSQAGFASAVRDLDSAAARTEAGLDALRYATENAKEVMIQRMEAAQSMALRLEQITAEAEEATLRADTAARTARSSAEQVAAAAAAAADAAAAAARPMRPERAAPEPGPIEFRIPSPPPYRTPAAPEAPPAGSRLREAAAMLRGERR